MTFNQCIKLSTLSPQLALYEWRDVRLGLGQVGSEDC